MSIQFICPRLRDILLDILGIPADSAVLTWKNSQGIVHSRLIGNRRNCTNFCVSLQISDQTGEPPRGISPRSPLGLSVCFLCLYSRRVTQNTQSQHYCP